MHLIRAAIIAASLALLWFTPHMHAHMHAHMHTHMHAQSDTTKFVPFRSARQDNFEQLPESQNLRLHFFPKTAEKTRAIVANPVAS